MFALCVCPVYGVCAIVIVCECVCPCVMVVCVRLVVCDCGWSVCASWLWCVVCDCFGVLSGSIVVIVCVCV